MWVGKRSKRRDESILAWFDEHLNKYDAQAITREVVQELRALGNYVFQWHGQRIDDCNTLAFQTAVKAAKVDPLRWHDLRQTWASWAVQSGVTLHKLMLLGGWRSFPMLLRYAHFAPDHLALAAAKVKLKPRWSRRLAR
ncbi:MAG: tyrosine-type recombinase/integrase [Steroidobacteraceae bacterium]